MSLFFTCKTRFERVPRTIKYPLRELGWDTPTDVILFLRTHAPYASSRADAERALKSKLIREPFWGWKTIQTFIDMLIERGVI